jgi:hypothetical protein
MEQVMLTYSRSNDGQPRATIPVWLRLTEEEVCVIQRLADSTENWRLRQLLHEIAFFAIQRVIEEETNRPTSTPDPN